MRSYDVNSSFVLISVCSPLHAMTAVLSPSEKFIDSLDPVWMAANDADQATEVIHHPFTYFSEIADNDADQARLLIAADSLEAP